MRMDLLKKFIWRHWELIWRGMLICLPVLVLAYVGFQALRQDRLQMEREAREWAQFVAGDLQAKLDALWRASDQEQLPGWQQSMTNRTIQDWIHSVSKNPLREEELFCAFCLDAQGRLVFPTPKIQVPSPAPADLTLLQTNQSDLWYLLQESLYQREEMPEALDILERFITSKPPGPFLFWAEYQQGLLLAQTGNIQAAKNRFALIQSNATTVSSESGLPLTSLAALQWATLHLQELTNRNQMAGSQAKRKPQMQKPYSPNLL